MLSKAYHSPLLMSIGQHSISTPDKIALVEGEIVITYAELARNILTCANQMSALGITKGNRILLSATKDISFVYAYFAAHLLGAVNVVVDSALVAERLEYIKRKTSPCLSLGFGHRISDDLSTSRPKESILSNDILTTEDVADIMFTTGTTGAPKGVCLTHANIAASASNINGFIGNNSDDIEVLGLPLSHSFGLGRLRCTLLAGGSLILLGNFANLKRFFEVIERHHVTGFGMVPAVWQYIKRFSGTRISKYADQLRYIEIGSAEMDITDKHILMELFPKTRICMHYGLTEASRAFFMEFHENANNLATIGRPSSSQVDAMIYGSDNEICIKGNMVMKTYLDEADNLDAFVDGYFRTGDSGYCDENGLYYLLGRVKEFINIGGNKVSPVTIEDAIKDAGALDCAVIPISDPSGILGEVPMAFVVTKEVAIETIRSIAATLLEPYQMPVKWQKIDRIPRTSSGKIQRLSLKMYLKS